MKQLSRNSKSPLRSDDRRGSTLLIVLALLGLLALLGFTFYTFAAQERAASEFFASEARITGTTSQPDGIFEWPLRQLILGPDDANYNSVLWGGRFSLVPGMLGLDGIPFNGEGVNVAVDASGNPFVDLNFDGVQDSPQVLTMTNTVDSPAANNGTRWGAGKSRALLPAPDTDYSYPDINNMILSYDGLAINGSSNNTAINYAGWGVNSTLRVIIPTLMRPQYLRSSGSPVPLTWYNSFVGSNSFRPHPDHVFIDDTGASTGTKRYVQTKDEANKLGLSSPFMDAANPFRPLDATGVYNGGELGVWTSKLTALDPTINLDVDTDGDGIRESILVDLGYPPFRRGDGKLVIPLFAMQVRDLNGLINLNTSTSKLTKNLVPPNLINQEFGADIFGNPRYLSSSNQGNATNEINPSFGLNTDPTTITQSDQEQYRYFLKMLGADRNPMNLREVANIEWFFLNYGRPQFNVQLAQNATATASSMANAIETITPGLLGDVDTMLSALTSGTGLPQAGVIAVNDNYDTGNTKYPFFWTTLSAIPQLGTPMDLFGSGSILLPNTSNQNPLGKKLNIIDRSTQPAIGPNRWMTFQGYHSNGDVYLSNSTYVAQLLIPSSPPNQLTDDSSEVIADPDALALAPTLGGMTEQAVQNDAVFGSLETAFLQESNGDGAMVRGTSRIANLIPLNTTASPTAGNIRSQYTTVSSDRREFNTLTTTQSGLSAAPLRAWESNYFASSPPAHSPLRPILWYHMSGYSPLKSKALRLSANQLLVDGTGDAFPTTVPSALMFRDLTAHPSQTQVLNSQAISTTSVPYPGSGNFSSAAQQEYFARRDRQAMARDIYVFLYLYGAGLDIDPSTTSNTPPGAVYSAAQMREMAQFAVNYVDAQDRDTVMTRFEYDIDLSDGWDLDDNAYTTTDPERKEVWGVESQQLTISEALAVATNKTTTNNSTTEWDDTTARFFTYIDLQSTSPYDIDFAANRAWQVRVLTSGMATTDADERRLTPLKGTIPSGGSFTILTSGDGSTKDSAGNPTSNFKVNSALVIPSTSLPSQPNRLDLIVDPTANFYLTDGTTTNGTTLPNVKSNPGDFVGPGNTPPGIGDTKKPQFPVIFQLMRRADPYRSPPSTTDNTNGPTDEMDNPWIEVDRLQIGDATAMTSGFKFFNVEDTTDATAAGKLLQNLTSRYRPEPFAADPELDFPSPNLSTGSPPANNSYNFIGNQKKYDPTLTSAPSIQHSQFHFDRPFASLGELLHIPVVGPGLYSQRDKWFEANETLYLTKALGHANQSPYNQVNINTVGSTPPHRARTAAAKFLLADFPDSIDSNQQLDNRWYRLLEFLEVPSPMHRSSELHNYSINTLGLPTNFGWPRVQGQLNMNTIRHSNVLAGLLDDNLAFNVQSVAFGPTQPASIPSRDTADSASYGTPTPITATRNFWFEFLKSRDGVINPLAYPTTPDQPYPDQATGLFIPGVAGTRPFRGFHFTSRGKLSQKQDSLFRNLPADATAANPGDSRALLEIGQYAEHQGTSPLLDSILKNRLLSKVMNNVTTRSNSFGVFIAVQYFEAAEDTSGNSTAIRIGGRLDDTPTQRGFFVIDRTGAVEQWKNLISKGMTAAQLVPNTFSIVPDTSTNGTPPNGINWKDLVLYRQILN